LRYAIIDLECIYCIHLDIQWIVKSENAILKCFFSLDFSFVNIKIWVTACQKCNDYFKVVRATKAPLPFRIIHKTIDHYCAIIIVCKLMQINT